MMEHIHGELVGRPTDTSIELSDVKAVVDPECKSTVDGKIVGLPTPHRILRQDAPIVRNDIFIAARSGDFDCVRDLLLQSPRDVISLRDDDGYSLLHWAALVGNVTACARFVKCGADVDASANNQQTPLMWACLKGHVAVINALSNAGANLACVDNMGASPLILAVQHNQLAVSLLLLKLRPSLLHSVDTKGCGVRFYNHMCFKLYFKSVLYSTCCLAQF